MKLFVKFAIRLTLLKSLVHPLNSDALFKEPVRRFWTA